MEIIPQKENSEEREEGEIVEDELEQVSDCPMTPDSPQNFGKSVSSPELLSSVCLSSVSSREHNRPPPRRRTRERLNRSNGHCKCGLNRKKRNTNQFVERKWRARRNCSNLKYDGKSSNSEDDNLVSPKYARQLRDALKHESTQELQISLRSRLKGFIGLDPQSDENDDDPNLDVLRNIALNSTTAKKQEIEEPVENSNTKLTNKEQLHDNIEDSELEQLRIAALKSFILENHERRKRKAQIQNNENDTNDVNKENNGADLNSNKRIKNDTEKHEDSDKLQTDTNLTELENQDEEKAKNFVEEDADILRAMLLASISKRLANEPDVKDVIHTETRSKTSKPIITSLKPISRTIKNDLYNHQKTNVMNPHVIVKPLIINVNPDSDSDTETFKETVTEFLKKQRAEVEANVNSTFNKSNDPLMEKSAMRLLPRSQQIEYRKLKQQLINARKKSRLRKLSQRVSESSQNNKKITKLKITTSSNNIAVSKVNCNVPEKKNGESNNFQKTLNELQIRKNGRLQMKGKYQSLATLIHRINQASNERREHELEIKKLLQEIQKVKSKLATSHKKFTNLVQQLVKEKQKIDERSFKLIKYPQGPLTSTPNKIADNIKDTPNSTVDIGQSDAKEEQNLVDPNDVTKVFVKQPMTFLKYTSPLNNRDELKDPLMTVCPYDLLGVCKDKDCQYKHCL